MTTSRPSTPGERRAPELRLPYPFLEYLLALPGDYAKLTLRLLQRAQWVPGVARHGVPVDAGEVLLSLRSRDLWGAVWLDRDVDEAGRVSLLRRLLRRLERDGIASTRAAQRIDTRADTESDTPRDAPATIVRFLKYRDILWPARTETTRETTRVPTHGATQATGTIPSREDPAVPAERERAAHSGTLRLPDGPRIADVRAVLGMAASAYEDVTGARYQHAQPPALKADRRAAADLLAVADGIEAIETVWRWALRQSDWPRIETLADLAQHWGRVAPRALGAGRPSSEAPACVATGCPQWERLASALQRRLRPDLFQRWFAPLAAAVEGDELVVVAPDAFHGAFLEDNYRELLQEELRNAEDSPHRGGMRLRVSTRPGLGFASTTP